MLVWYVVDWSSSGLGPLMNLRVLKNVGKFLSIWATGGFSRMTQCHGVSLLTPVSQNSRSPLERPAYQSSQDITHCFILRVMWSKWMHFSGKMPSLWMFASGLYRLSRNNIIPVFRIPKAYAEQKLEVKPDRRRRYHLEDLSVSDRIILKFC
jgi:hypothetical protein